MKSVYKKKQECCGCGLCASMCSVHAISMTEDEMGYLYPVIDEEKCIDCGKCRKSCSFYKTKELKAPLKTYAAVRSDKNKLMDSSSGGVFAAIAEMFLERGDYVCGARIESNFSVKHVLVSDKKDLLPLLGSKYVQSDISEVLDKITGLLDSKKVLFCGTPCQVQAIKARTGNSANLFTIELICHGVPNIEMFKAYINYVGKSNAKNYIFRDKKQGWSYNGLMTTNNGKKKKINHRVSSYMTLFMGGELYRDSCFVCPYANPQRGADLTIGDFWGVVRKCPEISKKMDIDKGVSCLLVNTGKGMSMLNNVELDIYQVQYSDIKDGNGPLNEPSSYNERRKEVLGLWKEYRRWDEIEKYWRKNYYKIIYSLWAWLPKGIRQGIRMVLGKR